jgi:hypothetical protein
MSTAIAAAETRAQRENRSALRRNGMAIGEEKGAIMPAWKAADACNNPASRYRLFIPR